MCQRGFGKGSQKKSMSGTKYRSSLLPATVTSDMVHMLYTIFIVMLPFQCLQNTVLCTVDIIYICICILFQVDVWLRFLIGTPNGFALDSPAYARGPPGTVWWCRAFRRPSVRRTCGSTLNPVERFKRSRCPRRRTEELSLMV